MVLSVDQRQIIREASNDGMAWLAKILDLEAHPTAQLASQLTDSPLKPFWVAQAQAILFYSFEKTAAVVGRASGHGFLIARLPTSHPSLILLSAPLFLDISFVSVGLSVGRTSTCSFVACLGPQLQQELLARGRHSLRGLDAGMQCGSALQERSDFITQNCAGGGSIDAVGISSVSGGIFDLSAAFGGLSVSTARNAAAYGSDVKPSQILDGTVDPPADLQPLYTELSLIVHQANSDRPIANPARVSASLERFSAGVDPEQGHIVLDDGTILSAGGDDDKKGGKA